MWVEPYLRVELSFPVQRPQSRLQLSVHRRAMVLRPDTLVGSLTAAGERSIPVVDVLEPLTPPAETRTGGPGGARVSQP